MAPRFDPRNKKQDKSLAQISLLAAVPAILVAAPLIGFFFGKWLDDKFNSEPTFLIIGLILGFAAAAREIYNLVKKSESLEKEIEKDKKEDGT